MTILQFPRGMKHIICALIVICRFHDAQCNTIHGNKYYSRENKYYWMNTSYSYDAQLKAADKDVESYNSTVKFYLYTKSTVSEPQQLYIDDALSLENSDFDLSRKTVIVSHGFMNSYKSDMAQDIKNGLLAFEDDNVIAVDWSHYAEDVLYSYVVSKVPDVGNFVGQFANFLVDQGLSPSNIHLIGHSLGAHISGFAGNELSSNGHKVARVTGLDPALPGFNGVDSSSRLSSTDGDFVDCIHTCAGLLGFDIPICQADFYPNGGENIQPGCYWWDFGACSHGRSYEFFAESINKTHNFYAETCNAVVKGVPYGCSNEGAIMGYYATDKYLGEFYLTTSSSYPYALNISSTHE